ncbi:hypothetical protein TrRE_jg10801 [Triparma retinervis]|uniref:Uncharacterized protein n=1 Tax=Triparma retinervis TaxID=2557542 RepID=A0A9W7AG54_9STRA|nr:hypothetical protein TrRE_jg10801 [Triparma retinervis]
MGDPSKCAIKGVAEIGANTSVGSLKAILYPVVVLMTFGSVIPGIIADSAVMALITLVISMTGTCFALAKRDMCNKIFDINAKCLGKGMVVEVGPM